MKNLLIFLVLILLLGMGLMYFFGNDLEDPEKPSESYITGEIYSMTEDRILVAEGLEGEEYTGDIEELLGLAIWFTVTEETEIVGLEGEELTFEDLETGKRVEVWNVGVVLESYPAQGTAKKIELIGEEMVAGECFIGGCSGELCTNDPEAISTCELLPGMECLEKEMSCELVENECQWVLSEEAAECFLAIKADQGEEVAETRIGYFFQQAEEMME